VTHEVRSKLTALFRAVLAAPEGTPPDEIRRIQRYIEQEQRAKQRAKWVMLPPEEIGRIYRRLGGLASAARHLEHVTSTLQRWRTAGRMPLTVWLRARELVEARVAPIRRNHHNRRDGHT